MPRNDVRDCSEGRGEGIAGDASLLRTNGLAHVTVPAANVLARLEDRVRTANAKPFDTKSNAGGFQAAKEGWLKVVISYPNLAGADYAVAVAISTFLNSKSGIGWPALKRLANMTNRNSSTVWRSIERLRKFKLLEVTKGRGRRNSNRYRPLLGSEECDPKTLRRGTKKTANSQ